MDASPFPEIVSNRHNNNVLNKENAYTDNCYLNQCYCRQNFTQAKAMNKNSSQDGQRRSEDDLKEIVRDATYNNRQMSTNIDGGKNETNQSVKLKNDNDSRHIDENVSNDNLIIGECENFTNNNKHATKQELDASKDKQSMYKEQQAMYKIEHFDLESQKIAKTVEKSANTINFSEPETSEIVYRFVGTVFNSFRERPSRNGLRRWSLGEWNGDIA